MRFSGPKYVGDPINTVKIFNDKEVDELILLDIRAAKEKTAVDFKYLEKIASECFMPLCYGGGVKSLDDIRRLLNLGIEKVCINTYAAEDPDFVGEAADMIGSQSIVVSVDVKQRPSGGYQVYSQGGKKAAGHEPVAHCTQMAKLGAGEIIVNSIDQDGMMSGYDLNILKSVTDAVSIPVIGCGGAGSLSDLRKAFRDAGVSAVAAGSLFVFKGKLRAVLINYPSSLEVRKTLYQ